MVLLVVAVIILLFIALGYIMWKNPREPNPEEDLEQEEFLRVWKESHEKKNKN